ncbi:uromodulin-like [Bufo bufo]|uniref:uromodulin-like n=1 Tax=Bufo bufo TaxID=8384 RepID=UPI001ABDAC8D|nr:uromodulin-like [Bufo bufo]
MTNINLPTMIPFTVFLLFITTHMVTSQWYLDSLDDVELLFLDFDDTTTTRPHNCKEREGTSFTLVTDNINPWNYAYSIENLVNRLSEKFPCVQRQYTLIKVNYSDIFESVTKRKEEFLRTIHDYNFWNYYNIFLDYYLSDEDAYKSQFCNHSILHGLKRALESSPSESFILTLSSGSVIDHNNTEILAEIYHLLNEKKSQVFFISYDYCASESQEDVLRDIATQSFGYYSMINIYSLQKAFYGLELFLLKPLNSSVCILNANLGAFSQYTEKFNVVSSSTFLMIITNGNGTFNFTDPDVVKGKERRLEIEADGEMGLFVEILKSPKIRVGNSEDRMCGSQSDPGTGWESQGDGNSPVFERKLSHITGNTYLVRFPISGTWELDMTCSEFCSIRIWEFADMKSRGNCSKSDCDPYASCEELGGFHECTCSAGFQGDGLNCHDIDECGDYFLSNCDGYCTNTIGSFNCSCFPGLEYVENEGCIDINECLNHDCHPFATCTNYYGFYTCTCLGGYNGDGKHCELECQKGTMCNSNTHCNVSLEQTGCWDPCHNYSRVDEQWRLSTTNFTNSFWFLCDYGMYGWYRFKGRTELRIPELCLEEFSCGTQSPLWINGTHPKIEDGTVNATVCASWGGDCCTWTHPISIRACPGGYYVYKIQKTPFCSSAYCTEPLMQNPNCSSMYCAADEECITLEGKSECQCRHNYHSVNAYTLYPNLVCESSRIKLSYSKCMLESMGYDTAIYLKDRRCTGFIERGEKSYVGLEMLPKSGDCGAELKVNKTHLTYVNSVYLFQKFDDTIQRGHAIVNFSCSYPLNMEVSLWTAINPFVSSVTLPIQGTGLYAAEMALYQDASFSRPFEGSDVWLSTDSMLYVGVIVEEIQEFNFVLLMKNCYATPTSDSGHPVKYYMIKDSCPNRNDPNISVQENGISLHGRFSIQVFTFLRNYNQVYLHCQIKLCDTSTGSCLPKCSGMRSANLDNEGEATMTLGPIHHRVQTLVQEPVPIPVPVPLSSGTGVTTSLILLILAFCLNLMAYK